MKAIKSLEDRNKILTLALHAMMEAYAPHTEISVRELGEACLHSAVKKARDALRAEYKHCKTCGKIMIHHSAATDATQGDVDCGGDCSACMHDAGDPDCAKPVPITPREADTALVALRYWQYAEQYPQDKKEETHKEIDALCERIFRICHTTAPR